MSYGLHISLDITCFLLTPGVSKQPRSSPPSTLGKVDVITHMIYYLTAEAKPELKTCSIGRWLIQADLRHQNTQCLTYQLGSERVAGVLIRLQQE